MDSLIEMLSNHGYWGMFVAAIFAGSVFPFSSEAVMLVLLAAEPWPLILYATVGNVIGAGLNYAVGHLGRLDWIERYLHVSKQSMERAERFMAGRGALMGFFAFLPVIGSAISVLLGLMRANIPLTFLSMTAGKFLRYVLLAYSVVALF